MPSSYKTTNLQLNKWQGTDIPKMADYNSDNQILDATIGNHLADTVKHMTAAEKTSLANQFVIGTYTGNNAKTRNVDIGFTPLFGFIFPVNKPLWTYDGDNYVGYSFEGLLSSSGCSLGLTRITNGFTVSEMSPPNSNPTVASLNRTGITYCYIMKK